MPPKKGTKTNKTAHVLNLLTGTADSAPSETTVKDGETQMEQKVEKEGSAPGLHTEGNSMERLVPPVVEVVSKDNALAEMIRNALEEDLGSELPPTPAEPEEAATELPPAPAEPEEAATELPPAPAEPEEAATELPPAPAETKEAVTELPPAPAEPEEAATELPPAPAEPEEAATELPPAPAEPEEAAIELSPAPAEPEEAVTELSPAPAEPEEAATELIPEPAEMEERAMETETVPEKCEGKEAEKNIQKQDQNENITYVNVMQELVEEKADKYMQMFESCSCPRCRADVKALALSNLPPKYVVVHKGEIIPMLTFYEGRFTTNVIAQLARACEQVARVPRHDI